MSAAGRRGPQREWELARLCAGTDERRRQARGRIEELVASVSWQQLTGLLLASRLLPSLGPRLLEESGGHADGEFRETLARALAAARHQDALLALSAARVSASLSAAGLRVAPLKGPQLGEAIFGEPGRRLSGDVDLLVAPAELGSAVEVARGLGYAAPEDPVNGAGLPLLHFSMVHERGELPPLELHWRIHWYEAEFAATRLLPPAPDSPNWRPRPADELAALLLFYARDGFTGLRQATDLGAWWDRFGVEVAAGDLDQVAASHPALAPALATARAVAARQVGLPAPRQPLRSRRRLAAELGARDGGHPSREQLFAEIALIDGLLTPPGELGEYWRRQIAPPPEVIREHAAKAGDEVVHSRLGFALRTVARYAISLSGLMVGRLRRKPPAFRRVVT